MVAQSTSGGNESSRELSAMITRKECLGTQRCTATAHHHSAAGAEFIHSYDQC